MVWEKALCGGKKVVDADLIDIWTAWLGHHRVTEEEFDIVGLRLLDECEWIPKTKQFLEILRTVRAERNRGYRQLAANSDPALEEGRVTPERRDAYLATLPTHIAERMRGILAADNENVRTSGEIRFGGKR